MLRVLLLERVLKCLSSVIMRGIAFSPIPESYARALGTGAVVKEQKQSDIHVQRVRTW
jgi:hypothetical protein